MKADLRLKGETATGCSAHLGSVAVPTPQGKNLTLAPYLALARSLSELLTPVRPDPDFRRRLHASLVASARQQQTLRALGIPCPAEPGQNHWMPQWLARELEHGERRWVLGAAALGSAASLLGVLTCLARLRRRTPATG